jgi:4-aminobutyrate aminotransferase-like enzyme
LVHLNSVDILSSTMLTSFVDDRSHLLNFGSPFHSSVIVKTSGLYIWTSDGKKIMDWTSGQMSCLIGHGHPEVVEAVRKHAESLDHLYSGMLSPPIIQLANKLTEHLPTGLDRAMFLSTGGEANECAMKLAKTVTGKFEIVGLSASWHGMTIGSNSAQYKVGRKGFGPLVCFNRFSNYSDTHLGYNSHTDTMSIVADAGNAYATSAR